ncbi:uncharacterized protein LOC110814145 [Carica papaya]|uniref:uncharacterized protein LOC110814145 n=1 Tax=Carica papaya TaxID=3649 RepID=UPI000B8CC605|nr:uncharacterized protein LOC110814145 [Carica papaya]
MASDESMTILSSMQEDEYDDTDDGFYHQPHHSYTHNLSRLSMCTSSMYTNDDYEGDDDDNDYGGGGADMRIFMSRLSVESFDGDDADEELSDVEKEGKHNQLLGLSSDSDKEPGCYSLPVTPPRPRRTRGGLGVNQALVGAKDYASENEAQKGMLKRKTRRNNLRKRRLVKESISGKSSRKREEESGVYGYGYAYGVNYSVSGESEGGGGGGGGGVVVITRPKGGRRSLCMDLEEVKACRDLGFELEHERMVEMPSRVSLSGSTLETSSGGNSPIANWRISSPGDDPRDVKARLKVWAQAVALASTSRHVS